MKENIIVIENNFQFGFFPSGKAYLVAVRTREAATPELAVVEVLVPAVREAVAVGVVERRVAAALLPTPAAVDPALGVVGRVVAAALVVFFSPVVVAEGAGVDDDDEDGLAPPPIVRVSDGRCAAPVAPVPVDDLEGLETDGEVDRPAAVEVLAPTDDPFAAF